MTTVPRRPVPARRRRRWTDAVSSPWTFAAPGLLVYAVFLVWPTVQSLWLSFTSWDGFSAHKSFVGLANYTAMLSDPTIRIAIRNNIAWAVATISIPLVLGLLLALALNGATRAKPLLRTIFYMPAVLPLVSVATIWSWLYEPSTGAINVALRQLGLGALAQSWLGQNSTALGAIMVPAIWVGTGFPMLLYLAALQGIPQELYEAARTDGASGLQLFRYITFPGLKYAHYIVLALAFVGSVKAFDIIYAMTGGGPGRTTQVLGTWMYANAFLYNKVGYGTAIAIIITILALAVGIPYAASQTREETQ